MYYIWASVRLHFPPTFFLVPHFQLSTFDFQFSVFSRSVNDSFSLILVTFQFTFASRRWNLSFIFFVYVCIRSMPDLLLFCNGCLMSGSFSHLRKVDLSIVAMLVEPGCKQWICKQWPFLSKLLTCAVLNPLFTEKRI